MIQTPAQTAITVAMLAIGTMATRFLPFLFFPKGKKIPPYLQYLGRVLPYAVIGLLVVYCLKDVSLAAYPHGAPEAIALVVTGALHLWRRNTLLSLGAGTAAYMLLVQYIF
nr:branched-chain amino acid transporter permease [bacterium]